jgi:hypothetical protein
MGRTMHGIEYNEVRDEIIVPQQFAQAIITFQGDAHGAQEPVRVIQGSRTQLKDPDTLALDAVHGEIFIPQDRSVLVFSAEADGNVAPLRVLEQAAGSRLAVDPVNNLLVAGSNNAISIYARTAAGHAKPIRTIKGPSLKLTGLRAIRLHPPLGLIFVAIRGKDDKEPYVGVWNINDEGDVPPRWTFAGPGETLVKPFGMAIDPVHQTVMVSDMKRNAVLSYFVPEIFNSKASAATAANALGTVPMARATTPGWVASVWSDFSSWIRGESAAVIRD